MSQVAALLRQGVAGMGLSLPAAAMQQLLDYQELLVKWNRVYNLTAIRDEAKIVSHHLLDCLAVVARIPAGSVVDVGSGAGLPGIPIAIACPEREVTLLDANQKKGAFLMQAVADLGLRRARAVVTRAEAYRPAAAFDVVISRAFAELADFVVTAGHLCAADGAMVAMKGVHPAGEMAQVPRSWQLQAINRLDVPQLNAMRHLVILRRTRSTSPDA